eukprot:TRINITY_DN22970_c0_g1_i1.p1 TRINITY_DN22970_c0_g1~~TRINITY_DN22970_c0_g1_i1.p1  ORF type:complete len:251 (-),score=19.13 TRINITY_DN22970_c0_g1_i1:951-1703(-)
MATARLNLSDLTSSSTVCGGLQSHPSSSLSSACGKPSASCRSHASSKTLHSNSEPLAAFHLTRVPSRQPTRRTNLRHETRAMGGDVGELGARDPTAGELGSNFGANPVANADTEHRISFPAGTNSILGLAQLQCAPLAADAVALTLEESKALLRKVVGWKIADVDGTPRLRGEWKVTNFVAGLELFKRIAPLAETENHHPDLHLENWNRARVDIWSHTVGGLTMNDFILAAKIDQLALQDLISKKHRFWA